MNKVKIARNIANIVHDLGPLLKSLQTKLALLASSREAEYQKLLKQIKIDVLMFEKYMQLIETNEVNPHKIKVALTPPRSVANALQDLGPLASALKNSLTALDNAERASDYARTMRLIKEKALLSENYLASLEQECAQFNIVKKQTSRLDLSP